jgi:hypothetical protein
VLRLVPMLLCIGALSLLSAGWEGEVLGLILSHIFSQQQTAANSSIPFSMSSMVARMAGREYFDEMIRNGWNHVVS